jgi:hypothetical protein
VEKTCLDDPQSCCNTLPPVLSSNCETSTGNWVVNQSINIPASQTVQLNCSSLYINGCSFSHSLIFTSMQLISVLCPYAAIQISGTVKSCFLQATLSAGTITATGCAELSGTIEVQVFQTPTNGQKQYVVQAACTSLTPAGSVVPVQASPNCNKVGGSTGKDSVGIFILFSVDSGGCRVPEASDSIQTVPIAAIGGSIAAAVVIIIAIIVVILYMRNKRFKEFRQAVKRRLSSAHRQEKIQTKKNTQEDTNNSVAMEMIPPTTTPPQQSFFQPAPEVAEVSPPSPAPWQRPPAPVSAQRPSVPPPVPPQRPSLLPPPVPQQRPSLLPPPVPTQRPSLHPPPVPQQRPLWAAPDSYPPAEHSIEDVQLDFGGNYLQGQYEDGEVPTSYEAYQ